MRDLAIRNTHSDVVTINGGTDATDVNGDEVTLDEALITAEVTRLEAANAQAELNATNQAYLASTDWYITRHAETGAAVPADVTTARAAARAAIV